MKARFPNIKLFRHGGRSPILHWVWTEGAENGTALCGERLRKGNYWSYISTNVTKVAVRTCDVCEEERKK